MVKRLILNATQARQGQTMNVTRWMLIAGLALVIPGLLLVWYFLYALPD